MSAPGTEQTFFDDPAIDRVLGVVLALATEVYVQRDRQRALERELERRGLLTPGLLDAEPTAEERAGSARERDVDRRPATPRSAALARGSDRGLLKGEYGRGGDAKLEGISVRRGGGGVAVWQRQRRRHTARYWAECERREEKRMEIEPWEGETMGCVG